ncbi:hypothetical protein Nepgr_027695 [Nepenthes gracilis]|uniref:Uncharacterized protein n=1 Tax=Nepenthes gracilis TaxID=150966 RepID=A0AAD3TAJ2_NEPGR|nr:hypothetical protein Nepgr_027695 [Nepenthes gracilis]
MHGFFSGSALLLNAEVDSMGGVIDCGVGIAKKISPCLAAIEKAQAELRVEYDVREGRRRELEFLEKGGNPLDFKFGHAASVSVQSISLTDQHFEQLVTSEAKGSFALTASAHGDSVESSGRLGATIACEPNTADNFEDENQLLESERKSVYPSRSNLTPSEYSSQFDGSQNAKELEDLLIFHPKRGQAYRRRSQSRTNDDGARFCSTGIASFGGHGSSFPGHYGEVSETVNSDNQFDMELDDAHAINSTVCPANAGILEGNKDGLADKDLQDDQHTENIKAGRAAFGMTSGEPDSFRGRKHAVPASIACSRVFMEKTGNHGNPVQLIASSKFKGHGKGTPTEDVMSNIAFTTKGLDSESSSTQASFGGDGNANIHGDLCIVSKNVDCNSAPKEQKQSIVAMRKQKDDKTSNGQSVTNPLDIDFCINNNRSSSVPIHQANSFTGKYEKEINSSKLSGQNEPKCSLKVEERKPVHTELKQHIREDAADDSAPKQESQCPERLQASRDCYVHKLTETVLSGSRPAPVHPTCSVNHLKVADKAHEDRILEEAQIIEDKYKRIAELSVYSLARVYPKKSHWDFVIEEMAWLANDFSQERLWKISAAAQISHWASFSSLLRLEKSCQHGKLKIVACALAKAVMEFWRSAEQFLEADGSNSCIANCMYDTVVSRKTDETAESRIGCPNKGLKCHEKTLVLAVQGYAVRFLQYNSSALPMVNTEVSETFDRASDMDIMELSWPDRFTEENLFYTVPPGAMETYRKSLESYLAQCEKMGNHMEGDADTSTYNAVAESGSQENESEEDVGEGVNYPAGLIEGSRSLKVVRKKRKNLKFYTARSYESGGDFAWRCMNRIGTQCGIIGKRSANSLNVGPIPTKRICTATRQRAVGPFITGAAARLPAPRSTDSSSGGTNSFQDDQSTLQCGSMILKGSEVESEMKVDKLPKLDTREVSAKPKKKKKAKNQWDHLKGRLSSHQYESNGSCGFIGLHSKKILNQSVNNSFGNTTMSGFVASSVASQMNNVSYPTQFSKLFGGQDLVGKAKLLKVPAGQPSSRSPWSKFEDQALVVLVHDMGPNWELVSDIVNSTLKLKCIFRMPSECNERHKILMDRTSGDRADGTTDSLTLPGIPKGSARQLFQHLQGPTEEDIIMSHFEKIILIGQQLHCWKKQDLKQIAPVHGSHASALSGVFPNNLNGGVLTPLDLCDSSASSPDLFNLGSQGSRTGGLASSNQGVVLQMLTSGAHSSLRSPPGISGGTNFTSPSAQLNGSVRDGNYGVNRNTTLPIDEQRRIQQCNNMLTNRNIQPSNSSVTRDISGADQNLHMLEGDKEDLNLHKLPSGNGMSMMNEINRRMPIPRPGIFQGIASSAMLNSGIRDTSNEMGMPGTINMYCGSGPSQGISMLRSRDALHLVQLGRNSDNQEQLLLAGMHMQVTQATNQRVHPFGGLTLAYPSQFVPPPVHTNPGHQQQQHVPQQHSNVLGDSHPYVHSSSHPATSELQAYAFRLARDRQLQQRMLQQQHQQFPATSGLMQNVQMKSQLPAPSSLQIQNSSQIQSQAASQPVSLPHVTPSSPTASTSSQLQKHQLPPHGLGLNSQNGAGGVTIRIGKQRQRQPQQMQRQQQFQQSGQLHAHQRQQSESLRQAKLLKGIGRGNMQMHQNIPMGSSHPNGLSANEQVTHLMEGQRFYSGSGIKSIQQSKLLVPPQPSTPVSLKQVQQICSHLESSNQSQVQPKPQLKLLNHTQAPIQRTIQQNCQYANEPNQWDSANRHTLVTPSTDKGGHFLERLYKTSTKHDLRMLSSEHFSIETAFWDLKGKIEADVDTMKFHCVAL